MTIVSLAIAFLLGGWLVPATGHAVGIYKADRMAPDNPSRLESAITAIIGGLAWPLQDGRYEGHDAP